MTEPKIGDRVRVVLEGEVDWRNTYGQFHITDAPDGYLISPPNNTVKSVEILEPVKKYPHNLTFEEMPVGTVVRASCRLSGENHVAEKESDDVWYSAGAGSSESNEEFTRNHTLVKVLQLGPKVRP